MQGDCFDVDGDVLARATSEQRAFAAHVRDTVRALRPTMLDVAQARAELVGGALAIELPHSVDPERSVGATVAAGEVVVHYGIEHEHFLAEDQASGRTWPVDAPDATRAALGLIDELLRGRIELEVRPGWIVQRTRSYRITDDGDRELFLRAATLRPTWRPGGPRVVRFGFGPAPTPEPG